MIATLIRYPLQGRRVVPSRARTRDFKCMTMGAAAERQTLDGAPSAGGLFLQIPNEGCLARTLRVTWTAFV